jgi:hypothetical protein
MALKHAGDNTATMRAELAGAVNKLFTQVDHEEREPRPLSVSEHARLREIVVLAVKLRGAVVRDPRTRELEQVHGEEGPGRLALSLERLLAGLDRIGVERAKALEVVEHVAMSSTPPTRRRAYQALRYQSLTTPAVAKKLRLPITTTKRALEELHAYQLVLKMPQGRGREDIWERISEDEEG